MMFFFFHVAALYTAPYILYIGGSALYTAPYIQYIGGSALYTAPYILYIGGTLYTVYRGHPIYCI